MKVENKTIIITDPCYIINKHEDKKPKWENYPGLKGVTYNTLFTDYTPEQMRAYEIYKKDYEAFYDLYDDWDRCNCGENMEVLGITNYESRSTIYGDWGCTTYNTDTAEELGQFCADAGMVAVFELDEVRAYNPDIDEWIEKHPWCVTTIKNFTGNVDIEVVDLEDQVDKEDYMYEEVRVIGKGNINFFTTQTSL